MERMHGKVAVVTGATSGIGEATALRLAREGANVVVSGRRESEGARVVAAIRAAGGDAVFVRADVTRKDDNDALLAGALAAFGRVDVVVLNAGIAVFGPLTDYEQSAWDDQIATNLTSVWHGLRAFVPTLRSAGGGSIVVTTTVAGEVGMAGTAAYAAGKGGANALVRAAAIELAPEKIRVNAVSPGAVWSSMPAGLFGDRASFDSVMVPKHPLGRVGETAEIADAIAFLASDDASFVTGQILSVDGGYTAQ